MVVRGDGSLVRRPWAMHRPIETILSGPAASAVGAWHLVQRNGVQPAQRDIWAVDVGGTTTDIAASARRLADPQREGRARGRLADDDRGGGRPHHGPGRRQPRAAGPRRPAGDRPAPRGAALAAGQSSMRLVVGELRMRVATPRTHRDEEIADFVVPSRQPGSQLTEAETRSSISSRKGRGR